MRLGHFFLPFVILGSGVAAGCSSTDDANGVDAASVDAMGAETGGDPPACAPGESFFYPGCGTNEEVAIEAGCYRPCEGAGDTSCPDGLACRRSDINPCVCPAGEGCCAACGAEQWLCLAPEVSGACEGRSYCGCGAGCDRLVDRTTGCVCTCESPFNCTGADCECVCGGATYLGCVEAGQCEETQVACPEGCAAEMKDGCPVCVCDDD